MAVGVIDSVSPFATAFDAAKAPDSMKFPEVLASQPLTNAIVSDPADHAVQDTADPAIDRFVDTVDGAPYVTAFRVVSALAAVVPAAPGSAVCTFRYSVNAVKDVARRTFSTASA